MARNKKDRLIQMAPHFSGFKPQGVQNSTSTDICINFEEYEALKLCDYELLTHAEAAVIMNVSRPTFTRIYENVRRKIAKAFIEGCSIYFEGGNVTIGIWYKCSQCKITFSLAADALKNCPFCNTLIINPNN